MIKQKILIVGTGDFATAAMFLLNSSGHYEVIGFSEELKFKKADIVCDLPNISFEDIGNRFDKGEVKVLVAVGPNKINTVRERLFRETIEMGFECITYVHPSAYVWDIKAVGKNCVFFPGAIVEPFAHVGNNCIMWSGSVLAHHAALADHCFLAPGAMVSARSVVGRNSFLGINSTIRDNITIGEKCIVGAGSVIKKDTQANSVYSVRSAPEWRKDSFETKV